MRKPNVHVSITKSFKYKHRMPLVTGLKRLSQARFKRKT